MTASLVAIADSASRVGMNEAAQCGHTRRPLTHSSDYRREGLAMQATRVIDLTPERIARFWSKVNRYGPTPQHRPELGPCWLWTGEKHTSGHGIYTEWSGNRRSLKFYAHRLSLLIAGHDLDGLVARHDCDNPPCVNPGHLRPGTQADNMQDAVERDRMNTSGLRITVWPPRPCRRCGTTVSEGRRRYCSPCRVIVTQESRQRWLDKQAAS